MWERGLLFPCRNSTPCFKEGPAALDPKGCVRKVILFFLSFLPSMLGRGRRGMMSTQSRAQKIPVGPIYRCPILAQISSSWKLHTCRSLGVGVWEKWQQQWDETSAEGLCHTLPAPFGHGCTVLCCISFCIHTASHHTPAAGQIDAGHHFPGPVDHRQLRTL